MEEYGVYSWNASIGADLSHVATVEAESRREAAEQVAADEMGENARVRETGDAVDGDEGGYVVVPTDETATFSVKSR